MTILEAYRKALEFCEQKLEKLNSHYAHLDFISVYDAYRNDEYKYSLVKFHTEYHIEGEVESKTLDVNVYCYDSVKGEIIVQEG